MKNTFKKNIGRTLSIFLALFLVIGVIPIAEVSAAEDTSNFKYLLKEDNTVAITSYTGNDVNVVIPQYIDGYTVTRIDHYTFFYKKNIESIYIPSTVTQLDIPNEEGYMFMGNGCLQSINVSEDNSVFSSEDGILYNKQKTKLLAYPMNKTETEFVVPAHVKEIGRFAFYYNANLQSISFEGKIDYIDEIAFSELRSIKSFYYPFCKNVENPILTGCAYTSINLYIDKEILAMNDKDFIGSNVTLHVYNKSYGLEWAKSHDFPYEIMEETPIEKDLVDEETGINVKGIMDPDATLKVEKVESTVEDAVATYDITLRKDGDVIQPSGTITISIPSEIKDCKLFWVKDDGTKVEVNTKYENDNYVFTTDHLSVYALVKETKPTVPEPVETTVPEPTVPEPVETTVPEPTVPEPVETTVPEPTVPEPVETTVPEPTVPEPVETTIPEPTVPEPVETTVPEPTVPEPVETTVPEPTVPEPVETTVAPPETTVESATDKVEPTKSVATPDIPSNNSNSGSSSGSSSASINNSSIVATGDMLGASNLLILSIIIMSATTGVSVILFRRKKEKVSNK